nr:hypothetical protein BdHM001_35460 [Bdellovibrio sp. HM001]
MLSNREPMNHGLTSRSIYLAVLQIQKEWRLSDDDLRDITGVSEWEMSEWRRRGGVTVHLYLTQKDQAIARLFRVQVQLEKLKETGIKRKNWIRAENKELGGKSPLQLLKSGEDHAVARVVMQIENELRRKKAG